MRDFKKDIEFLKASLDESLLPELYKDKKSKQLITKYSDIYAETVSNEKYDATADEIYFYGLIKALKTHFDKNFYDFYKFSTDGQRVEASGIFRQVVDFHKYGYDALPDYMKHAGNFKYIENAPIQLTMTVRGMGKSVYLMSRAVWNLSKNITDKVLIIHGKKDMSKSDMDNVRAFITTKHLALVYPFIFQGDEQDYKKRGGRFRSTELDIKPSLFIQEDPNIDSGTFKKESSFGSASLRTNETGKHISRYYFDDLVNEDTSKSAEATQQLISYFEKLEGLEEYDINSERDYGGEGVGTEWYENSLYQYLRDSDVCSVFSLPVEWTHAGTKYYISDKIWNDEKIEIKRKKNPNWFLSQYHMIPRKLTTDTLDLKFDPTRHILNITDAELKTFKKTMVSVQTCDPSYSKKFKKEGDGKSRFTILHSLMSHDTLWIYDLYSSLGEGGSEGSEPTLALNLEHAISHEIDVFIMDSQGTQSILYEDTTRVMKRDYDSNITMIPVTNGSIAKGNGKIEIANNVMRDLFLNDKIKVIITESNRERVKLVIDQLSRLDPGLDIIDCLVYTKLKVDTFTELDRAQRRHGVTHSVDRALKGNKPTIRNSNIDRALRRRR